MNVSQQLRGVADLVEEIEDSDVDAEVHDAHLDGVSVNDSQVRAQVTLLAPLDEDAGDGSVGDRGGDTTESAAEESFKSTDNNLQDRIVQVLRRHGELSASDIKLHLEISTDSHYDALAVLKDEGSVLARRDPDDGRRTLYRLPQHDIEDTVDETSDSTDDAEEEIDEDAGDESDDEEIECDVDDCDYTSNERGLAIHKARQHNDDDNDDSVEVPTDDEIRSLRKARDWTQSELGDELDCSGSTIANWESDSMDARPSRGNAKRLRDLMDDVDNEGDEIEATDEDADLDNSDDRDDDGADDDDHADESEEGEEAYPRTCHCGTEVEGHLERAVHRTEEHDVPQQPLNNLNAGEFEEKVDDADNVLDLADDLDWSPKKTMTVLGIYERNDVDVDVDGTRFEESLEEVPAPEEAEPEPAADEGDDDHANNTGEPDLQAYNVSRRDLVDALEGAQTVHQVQRELGIGRDATREVLDEIGLLDRIDTGCAPLSFDDAKTAVGRVA